MLNTRLETVGLVDKTARYLLMLQVVQPHNHCISAQQENTW